MDWGTGLMMKLFKKWYSLTGLLVALLLIYTISLLVYRVVFESMETQRMMNAFPNLWNVVEDTEILEQERYEDIPIRQFPHSAFIVFDKDDKSVDIKPEQINDLIELIKGHIRTIKNIPSDDISYLQEIETYFNNTLKTIENKKINSSNKEFYSSLNI